LSHPPREYGLLTFSLENMASHGTLSSQQMELAIPKINRRITDLENFDINSVNDRGDPRIDALAKQLDTLLVSIFGAGTVEYDRYRWGVTQLDTASINMFQATPIEEVRYGLGRGIAAAKAHLEAIKAGFLEEIEDANYQSIPGTQKRETYDGNRVFIVHGHADELKHDVARFIEKFSLKPIILHEQPNRGRTLIEKFEENSDVGFAIVLLTPDDIGGATDKMQNPRARQNVILELGYFIGKLGRQKVCALYSDGVELPSDLSGIVYIKFDKGGAWKFQVSKELKASGIDIDLNKVI